MGKLREEYEEKIEGLNKENISKVKILADKLEELEGKKKQDSITIENEELKKELSRLKNRSFWDRVFDRQ